MSLSLKALDHSFESPGHAGKDKSGDGGSVSWLCIVRGVRSKVKEKFFNRP